MLCSRISIKVTGKIKRKVIIGSREVFFIYSIHINCINEYFHSSSFKGDTAKLFEELAVTIIGAIFFLTTISYSCVCSK